jgi:hypothetical protein
MKIFISDSETAGTHGATIKAAILANNPNLADEDITLQLNATLNLEDVLADMATAFNGGYQVFINASSLITSIIAQANIYWQQSQTMRCIFPLGSNTHEQLTYTPDERSAAVTCGASDTANNETGYGNALWFFDNDNDSDPSDASSFSTGVIAGKLLYIKQQRNCGWWEAIYAASQTASENGTPSLNNGYGIINVSAAIAWEGIIPWDPYLPIGTVGTLTGSGFASAATLNCAAVTNAELYYLEQSTNGGATWQIVDTKPGTSFAVTLAENSSTQFRYRAGNGGGLSEYSNIITIIYSIDMATIRTTIINAVKAALLEIDGTGGYATNFASRVEIGRVKPYEQDELPAINIKYANSSPEVTDFFSSSGPTQKWNKQLPLQITVAMPDNSTYAEVDDASADVFRKIGEDDKFGVANIEMTNPETEQIADEAHQEFLYRGTVITLNILYRTNQWQI